MDGWKMRAKKLFFDEKRSLQEIAEETGISRQSISAYLNTLPEYQKERKERKEKNAIRRREYKKEKNRQYREEYRNRITPETIRREHDIAVMILSHEKYH